MAKKHGMPSLSSDVLNTFAPLHQGDENVTMEFPKNNSQISDEDFIILEEIPHESSCHVTGPSQS